MLAETLHSLSDCANQLLLLLGVKRSKKPADAAHPLGYGRNLYFWSFMVAMLLFLGGGAYSIYEGIHKLQHPEPISSPYIAVRNATGSAAASSAGIAGGTRATKCAGTTTSVARLSGT